MRAAGRATATSAREDRTADHAAPLPAGLIARISGAIDGLAGEQPDLAADLRWIDETLDELASMVHSGPSAGERAPRFERELQRVRFAANGVLEQRRTASAARDRRLRDAVIIMAWTVERAASALRDGASTDGNVTAPVRPPAAAPEPREQGDGLRGRAA